MATHETLLRIPILPVLSGTEKEGEMMCENTDFKDELKPYAKMYAEMYRNIANELKGKSVEELKQLVECSKRATESNCWWAAYIVAGIVCSEARSLLMQKDNGGES